MRLALPLMLLALGLACKKDADGPTWVRFNHEDDHLEITIVDGEPGPPVYGDLTSTTGEAIIGDLRVDPGSGPVGTSHELVITVLPAWEDRVRRADLAIDSGIRGETAFTLEQDSAEPGIFRVDLTSYGAEGEARVDVVAVALYELVEEPLPDEEPE